MKKKKDFNFNAHRVILFSRLDEKFIAEYIDVRLYEDVGLIKPTGLRLNRNDVGLYFHKFTKFFGVDYFDTLTRNEMCKLIFCFLSLGLSSTKKIAVSFNGDSIVNYQVFNK